MLRVRALALDTSRVPETPARCKWLHGFDLHPLLEVDTRDVTRLQLEAQMNAGLEDLDDGLLAYLLHEVQLVARQHLTATAGGQSTVTLVLNSPCALNLVEAHLAVESDGLHVVRVLVEARFLDGTAAVLLIEQRAALATAHVLQSSRQLCPQSGSFRPIPSDQRVTLVKISA